MQKGWTPIDHFKLFSDDKLKSHIAEQFISYYFVYTANKKSHI